MGTRRESTPSAPAQPGPAPEPLSADGLPARSLPVAPLDARAAARHVASEGADHTPSLVDQVARVPTDPGCYLWKDADGEVIYVGMA